ncbi:MAG: putative Ig domain-containing protein [Phycisphaerae bacterium]|nr:putative Ig domain-containing protein [Phycisphaerae bacterium]
MQIRRWVKRCISMTSLLAAVTSCQGPPLIISPTTLPHVIVGNTYRRTLTADSENAVVWRISAGSLPPGLSLNQETGVITGTFTRDGAFTFTVTVEESGLFLRVGVQSLTLTVIPKLTLDASLESARQNEAYSHQFEPEGGVQPYAFELEGHGAGMTFDGATGTLSGTPSVPDPGRTLQVTVSDSGDPQQTITEQTTFVVKPPPVHITTTALPNGQEGVAYSQQVQAADGFTPYEWSITNGVLPDGLDLPDDQQTGLISGTPPAGSAGNWTFTITVTDGDIPPTTDSKELTIVIAE